jgi:hypothetical protein
MAMQAAPAWGEFTHHLHSDTASEICGEELPKRHSKPESTSETSFKNGRHLRQDDARALWKKLQADDWRQCTPQWGEDAEV